LYLDDTPIQSRPLLFTGSPDLQLFDLERVEVLRGPQGTLFGASSLGGTIRLITRQPDLRTLGGEAAAELSATKGGGIGFDVTAAAGGPIVADRLGFRTAVRVRREAGYVDRVNADTGEIVSADINDMSMLAIRGTLRAETEGLSVTPSVLYQRSRSDDLPFFESSRGPQRQAFLADQPGKDELHLTSLTLETAVAGATLTSVSSYYGRHDRRVSDYSTVFGELVLGGTVPGLRPLGGTSSLSDVRQRNVTQEVRLAGTNAGTGLSWVAGVFLQRSSIRLVQEVAEPGVDALSRDFLGFPAEALFGTPLLPGGVTYRGRERAVETQLAAFGEVNWRFTPRLEAVAGVRLFRSALRLSVGSEGPYAGPDNAANRVEERNVERPVTPRIGLNFHLREGTLLYVGASKGYRAGGANTPVPVDPCRADLTALGRTAAPASYGSDALWNYEAGAKLSALERRLTFGASVFQIDWTNIQQQVRLPACGFSFVDNLGRARNRGFEAEAELRPVPDVHLSAAVGYVDARLRTSLFAGGAVPVLLVARGDRLPFTPQWTISGAAEYRLRLGAARRAFLRAEYQYVGAYQRTPAPGALSYNQAVFNGEARSYALMRAGLEGPRWSASLFVSNLFDDRSVIFSSADLVPATLDPLRQTTLDPRRIGLQISTRF
jgi:outer membrane receptor protein involved in Fe transport